MWSEWLQTRALPDWVRPWLGVMMGLAVGGWAMAGNAWQAAWAATEPVPLSTPPVVQPQSLPVQSNPGDGLPFSVDNPANQQDYMRYEPYNLFPRELNLWNLEGKRFIRSTPVLSPDKTAYAYSEVLFVPNLRQTISQMYWVRVPDPPMRGQSLLPSQSAAHPEAPPPPSAYTDRFDPNKTVQSRKSLVTVGYDRVKPFEFRTLTVVDWSASGTRLLFKERKGVLHVGLQVSEILVYDESRGTITIYPEVHRVIQHYWQTQGNLPHLPDVVWDLQPLGWEPHSDSTVLLKAWAYDKNEKKFLGLWRYDVDAERTQLVQLEDVPVPVAANGWIGTPVPIPPEKSPRFRWLARPKGS